MVLLEMLKPAQFVIVDMDSVAQKESVGMLKGRYFAHGTGMCFHCVRIEA